MPNEREQIGGNFPPDAIETLCATHENTLIEASNWTDGALVDSVEQMKVVDGLIKDMKAAKKDAVAGQKSESTPHFDAHKAAIARWKPTVEDFQRIIDCLLSSVGPFKKQQAAEKAELARLEWEKVNAARLEAERLAAEANASDLEAQREVEAARQATIDAEKSAKAAAKDTPKGMRKTHKYEITDHREVLHFIAKNHKDDMTAFIEEWVRKNHKAVDIDGCNQWIEKEPY